jgi:hypothetical protein
VAFSGGGGFVEGAGGEGEKKESLSLHDPRTTHIGLIQQTRRLPCWHLSQSKGEGVAEVGKPRYRGYLFGRRRESRKDRISLPVPSEPCHWAGESLAVKIAWSPLEPWGSAGAHFFVPKATRRLVGLAMVTGTALGVGCDADHDKHRGSS